MQFIIMSFILFVFKQDFNTCWWQVTCHSIQALPAHPSICCTHHNTKFWDRKTPFHTISIKSDDAIFLKLFYIPLKKSHTHLQSVSICPSSSTSNLLLSLQFYVFWTFHITGTAEYITYWTQLLSISTMSSRFTHIIACVSHRFLWLNISFFV